MKCTGKALCVCRQKLTAPYTVHLEFLKEVTEYKTIDYVTRIGNSATHAAHTNVSLE
jgi:hypothetical protein